ncbi:hypothetical protein PANA5342_1422 [Pantoea ananatis LMG 5342]|nr:hypothetical protein PANA5342_1422 [Pantoea ananatis LMG 5342]
MRAGDKLSVSVRVYISQEKGQKKASCSFYRTRGLFTAIILPVNDVFFATA